MGRGGEAAERSVTRWDGVSASLRIWDTLLKSERARR